MCRSTSPWRGSLASRDEGRITQMSDIRGILWPKPEKPASRTVVGEPRLLFGLAQLEQGRGAKREQPGRQVEG